MTDVPLSSLFHYPELFRERPFVYVLDDESIANYCHFCLKSIKDGTLKALQRCGGCQFARYCDQKCQKAAWADHKQECKCLRRCDQDSLPSKEVRMFARLFFKRQQPYVPDERLPAALKQRRLGDLKNNVNNCLKDVAGLMGFQVLWAQIEKFVGQAVAKNVMLDLFGKIKCNGITIDSGLEPSIGEGLYVGTSSTLLKHSCEPDVFPICEGPELVVRALKPGLEGKAYDQLTMAFAPSHMETTARRRAFLSDHHYFHCQCAVCQDTDKDAEMRSIRCQHCLVASLPVPDDPLIKAIKCPSCGHMNDVAEADQLMKEIGKTLDSLNAAHESAVDEAALSPADLERMREDMWKLAGRARRLLAPVNVFSGRLALATFRFRARKMLGQRQVEALLLQAFPAYERFGCHILPDFLMLLKNVGSIYISGDDQALKTKGIRLLHQASIGFDLYNMRYLAKMCLEDAVDEPNRSSATHSHFETAKAKKK